MSADVGRVKAEGARALCVELQSDTERVCACVCVCMRVDGMDRLKHELHHSLEVKPNWIGLYNSKGSSRSTSAGTLSLSRVQWSTTSIQGELSVLPHLGLK